MIMPRRGGSRRDSTLRSYSDADPERTLNPSETFAIRGLLATDEGSALLQLALRC